MMRSLENKSSLLNLNNFKQNSSFTGNNILPKQENLILKNRQDVKQFLRFSKNQENTNPVPLMNLKIYGSGPIQEIFRQQYAKQILSQCSLTYLLIDIPGYGLFRQNQMMAKIIQVIRIIKDRSLQEKKNQQKQVNCMIKTLILNFPAWIGIQQAHVNKLCQFIIGMRFLEHLSVNFGNWMAIKQNQKVDQDQILYYGKNTFGGQNYHNIMKLLKSGHSFTKLQLRFPNWRRITSQHIKLLNQALQIQKQNEHLRFLTLQLSGWGHKNKQIMKQHIQLFRGILQEFNRLQQIHIDLRNWDQHYQLSAFKQKLKINPSLFANNNSQVSKLFKGNKSKRISTFGKSQIKNKNNETAFKLTVLI